MMVKPKHAIIRIGRSCIFLFFFREERGIITFHLTYKFVGFKSIMFGYLTE
jgi:hypothetical protein